MREDFLNLQIWFCGSQRKVVAKGLTVMLEKTLPHITLATTANYQATFDICTSKIFTLKIF